MQRLVALAPCSTGMLDTLLFAFNTTDQATGHPWSKTNVYHWWLNTAICRQEKVIV